MGACSSSLPGPSSGHFLVSLLAPAFNLWDLPVFRGPGLMIWGTNTYQYMDEARAESFRREVLALTSLAQHGKLHTEQAELPSLVSVCA